MMREFFLLDLANLFRSQRFACIGPLLAKVGEILFQLPALFLGVEQQQESWLLVRIALPAVLGLVKGDRAERERQPPGIGAPPDVRMRVVFAIRK